MLVIIGSSDLWVTPEVVAIVVARVLAFDPIVPLGVRVPRGSDEPTTMLEQFVVKIAPDLGRVVARCRAISNRREAIYARDWQMVQSARQVVAFFAPDQEMEGGTGHVVTSALARNIPVEAYRMGETGCPELLGSDEGFLGGSNGDPYYGAPDGTYLGHYATGTTLGNYSTSSNGTTFDSWSRSITLNGS